MKIVRLISILSILVLIAYLFSVSSCTKESSCEGCELRDTIPTSDTIITRDKPKIDSTINFPLCPGCTIHPSDSLNKWSFKNYKSFLCGNVYYAQLDFYNGDTAHWVTVRGFQDCTKDTQFVITGRFTPQTFQTDQANVTASYSNFLLYAPNNVILAVTGGTPGTPLTMNMVLDSFNHATGVGTFRFFGYAYTNKGGNSYMIGDSSYISDGKIKVKLK